MDEEILLVVNVGSLEKRSNQPKYKDKNKKSKDYCKADLKQRVLFLITSVTSVNLKKASMASRNIVIKSNCLPCL